MNELSLFTGAGGGILGTYLLGFRPIGYVEWDGYCQRVLAQRIKDGILHEAPIFCDVRAFIREGYAASYTGMVDVLTAGFPCQPFSVAGKRKGVDDERNMWPATADVIRIVRPRRVLLENVPGIREYLPVVIRDLRRLGYSVRRPLILGAGDCGAPHKRDRVWIVAHAERNGCTEPEIGRSIEEAVRSEQNRTDNPQHVAGAGSLSGTERNVDNTQGRESGKQAKREGWEAFSGRSKEMANASSTGLSEPTRGRIGSLSETPGTSEGRQPGGRAATGRRDWPVEPNVGRVAHGVASRVDRLKALGNGQVPLCVATAFLLLTEGIIE